VSCDVSVSNHHGNIDCIKFCCEERSFGENRINACFKRVLLFYLIGASDLDQVNILS
jgi:hypothetical protein